MYISIKDLRALGVKVSKDMGLQQGDEDDEHPPPPVVISLRFDFDEADRLWIPSDLRELPLGTHVTFDEHIGHEYKVWHHDENIAAGYWVFEALIDSGLVPAAGDE